MGGFRASSSRERFWLEGAGNAWHWDSATSEWVLENLPRGSLQGLAPIGDGLIAVMIVPRKSKIGEKPTYDLDLHLFSGSRWERIATAAWDDLFDQVVGTTRAGYLRTRSGDVFQFDRRGIERIAQPGPCEALARTSEGELLASFVNKGIFQYEAGEWRLKCAYPYGPEEGKHWAFLSEANGRIAFATCAISKLVDVDKGTSSWSGTSAVWVLKGGALERVRLGNRQVR
jgi:hypothetical protein